MIDAEISLIYQNKPNYKLFLELQSKEEFCGEKKVISVNNCKQITVIQISLFNDLLVYFSIYWVPTEAERNSVSGSLMK